MLGVVVSRADGASVNIGDRLREIGEWTELTDEGRPDAEGGGTVYRTDGAELREIDGLHLETDGIGEAFGTVDGGPDRDVDVLAFASRHAGETGPLLTAHPTGNLGPAEFGGTDGTLARAPPNAHRRVLAALAEHAPPDYDVGTECTHHGPSEVGVPSMFVEVGSGEDQWGDPDAARAVARAILALRDVDPDAPPEGDDADADSPLRRHLVGIGGGHYAPRFERVVRETDWAVGHVAADWALDAMGDPRGNRDVIDALFTESAASLALLDGDYPAVEAVVDELGYGTVSETWVRETAGVPLGLADRLASALCPVDDGLRFGDRTADDGHVAGSTAGDASGADRSDAIGGSFETVPFPTALLAETQGIDPDATRAAVETTTLAFETTQSGTRLDPEGRAAVSPDADRGELIDALAGVLDAEYDDVERVDGAVLAHERAFDPGRARDLGVPEGPAFGELSAGRSVEVDGRTVRPEDVHVERERRFPTGTE